MSCKCKKSPLELERFERIQKVLDDNNHDPHKLIPILHAVQNEYRYLPEDAMNFIANALKIPAANVFSVATFYGHFALNPKGKYIIKVCDGTACHVKGSMNIYGAIEKKLRLSSDKKTTEDMLFTLETVSCLGACGLAPVVVINEEVFGQATPDKMNAAIDEIIKKEKISE